MATESNNVTMDTATPTLQFYLSHIKAYEKRAQRWYVQCDKIAKRYADERNQQSSTIRFNILWSNVETMAPALFSRTPLPYIERRFKDKDPVGLKAAEVLERCVTYSLEQNDIEYIGTLLVQDFLLHGRAVSWERYEPVITNTEQISGDPKESLSYEYVCTDFLCLRDFGHSFARTWNEVRCVWRVAYLTKAQLKSRFKDKYRDIPLDYKEDKDGADEGESTESRAAIYELWDKETRKVNFISKGVTDILESIDPPVNLGQFFPCPRPLYATLDGRSLIPTPDYVLYQDQAIELDTLTARISKLASALKVAGAYDSSVPALADLLDSTADNRLIPVDSFSVMADKGGIAGSITFMPIKEIAEVLIRLYEARDRAKQDLYEKTGISDIIRGATNANETATAQQIKGQFANLRLSKRQKDVQRYLRDLIRIKAEIMAEAFTDETIKAMSGVKLLTQQEKQQLQMISQSGQQVPPDVQDQIKDPSWDEVIQLLRTDPLRGFRIDIETDSTVQIDEQAEKQSRMEYVQALTQGLKAAAEIGSQSPQMLKLVGKAMQFGARAFKNARELESTLEETIESIEKQMSAPPQPPPPDPEMIKAQKEIELKQRSMEIEAQNDQRKMQIEEFKAQREVELKQWQAEQDMAIKSAQAQSAQELAAMKAEHEKALAVFKESARADIAESYSQLKQSVDPEGQLDVLTNVLTQIADSQGKLGEALGALSKPKRRRAVVDGQTIDIEELH